MTQRNLALTVFVVGASIGLVRVVARGQSVSPPAGAIQIDQSRLSQPKYKMRSQYNVRVPMRDGVELSADIYRPEGEGQFPTLLVRTPYDKREAARTSGGLYAPKFYVERGYVVMDEDTRGRFDSDGSWDPFRDDVKDGYDTLEWIGRQPWSDRRVAGLGQSFFGLTQLLESLNASRHLSTIIPVMSTLDTYHNWIYSEGGPLNLSFALGWGTGIGGRVSQRGSITDWRPAYWHLPLETMDEEAGLKTAHIRDWIRHPTRDQYWDAHSYERVRDQVSVPVLFVTTWYDIFMRGALADFATVRQRGKTEVARTGTRIIIGPWIHFTGTGASGSENVSGDMDFGPQAKVDFFPVQLRWYDHWLKGVANGVADDPPMRIFVMGENYWRSEQEWPLKRTTYTNYYLQSGGRANSLEGDGALSTALPKADSAKDTFTYDPAKPVPTTGGNLCCNFAHVPAGPYDQRPVERRDDVLVYTTAALTQPVEATGPITVKLFASTTAKDTDFTAKLVDVHPNGYVQNLQDGIIRARYRTSRERAEFIEPGKVYEYTIDLWATSNVFLPGHRIRVEVSSSNFPHYDRNLNTGEDTGTGTKMVRATQTIYHDAEHPSHIVLPIIPAQQRSGVR